MGVCLTNLTNGGDEGEKDKAKKTIIYVIIGIIVVLFARVIVSFVNTLFSN
jgi:glucose uptake protein GlcU